MFLYSALYSIRVIEEHPAHCAQLLDAWLPAPYPYFKYQLKNLIGELPLVIKEKTIKNVSTTPFLGGIKRGVMARFNIEKYKRFTTRLQQSCSYFFNLPP